MTSVEDIILGMEY
jgi:hypothetical protein